MIYVKSKKYKITDLPKLNDIIRQNIKDGYYIEERIKTATFEKFSGHELPADTAENPILSLTVFNQETEFKIIRDGGDVYFRQVSEKEIKDVVPKELKGFSRGYILKGEYDSQKGIWRESQFPNEFKYPLPERIKPKDKSRIVLNVMEYRDDANELKYYRLFDITLMED